MTALPPNESGHHLPATLLSLPAQSAGVQGSLDAQLNWGSRTKKQFSYGGGLSAKMQMKAALVFAAVRMAGGRRSLSVPFATQIYEQRCRPPERFREFPRG